MEPSSISAKPRVCRTWGYILNKRVECMGFQLNNSCFNYAYFLGQFYAEGIYIV